MRFALKGAHLLTPSGFADDRAVIVDGGRVEAVVPVAAIPPGLPVRDLGGGTLAPGFVDVQVNGGAQGPRLLISAQRVE